MFSRLNEAVPLSSAEKRNAIGGPMAECIRAIADHHFFRDRVRFGNKRYQHREVSARLLFLEYSLIFQQKIVDTKKPYLDDMVRKYKRGEARNLAKVRSDTTAVLNNLDAVFVSQDDLLRSQSAIPILSVNERSCCRWETTASVEKSNSCLLCQS